MYRYYLAKDFLMFKKGTPLMPIGQPMTRGFLDKPFYMLRFMDSNGIEFYVENDEITMTKLLELGIIEERN